MCRFYLLPFFSVTGCDLIRVFCCSTFQVVVEVAVSLLLFLWAALKVPGSFLPILPDAEANRWESWKPLLFLIKECDDLRFVFCL